MVGYRTKEQGPSKKLRLNFNVMWKYKTHTPLLEECCRRNSEW